MQMISSNRANAIPPILLGVCLFLVAARFACILYDIYWSTPSAALIAWDELTTLDKDAPNLTDKPLLVYFVNEGDLFSHLKGQAFEGIVLKNREVAKLMNDNFRCLRYDLSDKGKTEKQKEQIERMQREYMVTAAPDMVPMLANGRAIYFSSMQLTDRLFYYSLVDALNRQMKVAGDVYMQRTEFDKAREAYKKYLNGKDIDDEARGHALLRYYFSCRLTGHDDDARSALLDPKLKVSSVAYGPMECIKFLRGEEKPEDFGVYCKDNPGTGKYVLGMKQLLDGKKSEGIASLKIAAERGANDSPDTLIARAQLRKMGVPINVSVDEEPAPASSYSVYN